jgi:hypothetical protein
MAETVWIHHASGDSVLSRCIPTFSYQLSISETITNVNKKHMVCKCSVPIERSPPRGVTSMRDKGIARSPLQRPNEATWRCVIPYMKPIT